jgi:hypothetical protein
MRTVRKLIVLLSILALLACTGCVRQILGRNGVSPEKIVYDKVPGYGVPITNEIYEWTQKSLISGPEAPSTLKPPAGLKLRWLGTAGFEVSDDETTILIDPFVTRPTFEDSINPFKPLNIDTRAVEKYVLKPIRDEKKPLGLKKIKAILISHSHDDHVLDAPYILAQYPKAADRPTIVGDRNVAEVLSGYSRPDKRISWLKNIEPLELGKQEIIQFNDAQKKDPAEGGRGRQIPGDFGKFKITAFISEHGLYDDLPLNLDGDIVGRAPYSGAALRAHLNSSLTYLIEYDGGRFRIFAADSPKSLHQDRVSMQVMAGGPIDLLLEGIASRKRVDENGAPVSNDIPARIAGFRPRYLVPTHFDDFFVPLRKFKVFDYEIKLLTDNSDLEGFLGGFKRDSCKSADPCPELRLMKMFYYYSLKNLLR